MRLFTWVDDIEVGRVVIPDLLTHDLFTPLATLLFSSGYGLMLAYIDKFFSPSK